MNKTLLLILCDFLLLTLLSLVNWEEEEKESSVSNEGEPSPQSVSAMAMMEQDLLDTLSSSLEEEKKIQESLKDETSEAQTALLAASQELEKKETSIQDLEKGLEAAKKREQDLAAEKVAAENNVLTAKNSITVLESNYEELEAKAKQTEAQARMLQQELESKLKLIEEKERALAAEQMERKSAESRVQELNVQVRVTEEQKKMLEENVESLKGIVVAEREERQQLQAQTTQMAEGITQLAERSQDLTEEFRSSQPVNANILFSRFNSSRIAATFRSDRFYRGQRLSDEDRAMTILVSDGEETIALSHLSSTPLGFGKASLGFRQVDVELQRGSALLKPPQLEFLASDPRIAAIPISEEESQILGGEVFYTAVDPFKFSEAVLIDEKGEYYGEVEFKLDANTPGYVRMQSKIFSRIIGEFSPSRGDLVFSKTGELLGLMVDGRYCVLINNLIREDRLRLGTPLESNEFRDTLEQLKNRLNRLPSELR